MCNLFFIVESVDIASYANDTRRYVCLEDIDLIIEKLEVTANEIFQCLSDKCHLLITTNEERNVSTGREKTQNSKIEKLLGITIDNKLFFTEHVHTICDKASLNLNVLARLSSFMSLENEG